MPRCHHCDEENAKCRCGQCKQVYFCNRDCQIKAWPTHRPECKPPTAEIANAVAPLAEKKEEEVKGSGSNDQDAEKKEEEPASTGTKKPKKKKKKAKQPNASEETPTSPQARPTPSSPEKNSPVKTPERVNKPVDDDWTINANAPKKSKKKSKQTNQNNCAKKERSLSMPNAPKPAVELTKKKSKSFHATKGVSWGIVTAREFARCPGGGGAVPDEGTWALGLGKYVQDLSFGPVDHVEAQKEHIAVQKQNSHQQHSHHTNHHHNHHHGHQNHPPKKEKKAGERMHRLTERERKEILMQAEEGHHQEPVEEISHSTRRRRLSSSDECDAHIFATLCLEQANEFALIRSSREGACGCSCGDLVKKVSKMHFKKLLSWLHDRGVDTTGMSKTDLTNLAKKIASEEKNCSTEDCECARNGVPCHQDVCSGCRESCHNERYSYKREEVHAYRLGLLEKWKQASPVAVC